MVVEDRLLSKKNESAKALNVSNKTGLAHDK